jgi:rod shape-determining protein MreC
MAPSPIRRPGYSRRAQYTTFFGYIAGVLGALLGGALLIVAIAGPSSFSGLRNLGRDATSPLGGIAARSRSGSYSLFETIGGYFAAGEQNASLKRQLAATQVRLIESQAMADENRRLKALLGLAQSDPKPVTIARLTGSSASSSRRFATLSAGASSGVEIGMPVRSPLGLIGRVLEVGHVTSRILLVTDSESLVPVRRASDSIPGFAQGRADGTVQIKLISLGINPLKRGDTFVTSGTGGLYRPGTPIAVVESLTRDGAIARLLSDPAASEFVAVEPVWTAQASDLPQPAASAGPARP